eukprot:3993403-Lingulodinium_polyedra.AAC.1
MRRASDDSEDQPAGGRGAPARQPIPEHEAVDFDGAARVAADVASERIPRAVCKRHFLLSWLCELDVRAKEFHRPVVEEADHIA